MSYVKVKNVTAILLLRLYLVELTSFTSLTYLCERDDRALDTAESLSESSDLIGGMATPLLLLLLLPLTGWLPRPTDGVDVDV